MSAAVRVVIMGNSGSGKSTLAAALAKGAALAHLDLDTLAWEPDRPTERRRLAASLAPLSAFLAANARWVIEGCYGDLLEAAAAHGSQLIFLNPGTEACIANCRARPWERHKYPTKAAQDANLKMLIAWVRDYEQRRDEFSLVRHRRVFDEFAGDKLELRSREEIARHAAAARRAPK